MQTLIDVVSHLYDEELKLVDNLNFQEPHVYIVRVTRNRFFADSDTELVKVYGGFASGRVNYIIYDESIQEKVLNVMKAYAEAFAVYRIGEHISKPLSLREGIIKDKKRHLHVVE
jgi:hypothetical protein